MKNRKQSAFYCTAAVMVAALVFSSCDSGSNSSENTDDLKLRLSDLPVTFIDTTDETDFSYLNDYDSDNAIWLYKPLGDYITGTPNVTIDNDKLTISLDIPKSNKMFDIWYKEIGATVTPANTKMWGGWDTYFNSSDGSYYLRCNDANEGIACLMYVNKNVTINGTFQLNGLEYRINNVSLLKGWNFWIETQDFEEMTSTVTATKAQSNGFEWSVIKS